MEVTEYEKEEMDQPLTDRELFPEGGQQ